MMKPKTKLEKFNKIVHRIEPISIFCCYLFVAACAYFAWFFPPDSVRFSLTQFDLIVQALLLTIGAVLSLTGHLTDRIFIEELGIIFATIGVILYCYALVIFIVSIDRFLNYGEAIGIFGIAITLLIARAIRIQNLLSAKWLKPRVSHIYEDE